jgi:septal ring factor EnvC (AmiA/AmiB activator)
VKGRPDRAVEEAVEIQQRSSPFPAAMIASLPVADRPGTSLPWLLVAASVLLLLITLYLFFGAYLPARQRVARLEAELKDMYGREALLQTKLAQMEKTHATREQQAGSFGAERAQLTRRIDELERELAAARSRRR